MASFLFTGYALPELVAGLRARGHEVHSGPELEWYPRAHGNLSSPPSNIPTMLPAEYGAFVERECRERGVNVLVLNKPFDTNLCAKHGQSWGSHSCGGGGLEPNFWHMPAESVARIRESGAVIVWRSLDDPEDWQYGVATKLYPLLDVAGSCSDDAVAWYSRYAPKVMAFRMWPGFDRLEYPAHADPERPQPEAECDFVMVAGTYYAPDKPGGKPNAQFGLLRRDVVRAALAAGAKVAIYGSDDWVKSDRGGAEDFAPLYRGYAPRAALADVFARSRIAYSSFIRRSWGYLTDRIPIAAGGGAFGLLEAQPGLGDDFRHGVHCAYHTPGSVDDVTRNVAWWLEHEDKRRACADAMRRLMIAEHNYDVRAGELDAAIREAQARRALEPAKPSCCR